ncbi:MAG: hypothetical protein QM767_12810 [Anaeromyxobacter sp.]
MPARPLPPTTRTLSFLALALCAACQGSGGSTGGVADTTPPAITAFSVAASSAGVGDTLAVSAAASDAESAVRYAWTAAPAGCGTFADAAASATTFTAAVAGTCTVTLTASSAGGSAQQTAQVQVSTVPPTDHPPKVTAFSVAQSAARVGDSFAVSASATDPDGDGVTLAWTATPAGCGTFAAPAAAATTFTAASAGTCSVRVTATARALTATQAADVTITSAGGGGAPTHHTAIDPLAGPPNGGTIWPNDTGSRAVMIRDAAPGAAGDLLGLFRTEGPAAWYLLRSSDGGASFQYLTASNAEPSPADAARIWSSGITQDTVTHKVHVLWHAQYGTTSRYARIALTRDGAGHVSGWSWEAENVPGPTFNTASSWNGFAKVDIKEVLDGNGAHVLAVVGMDQPSDTRIQRLLLCRTTGASALAPAATADWKKATDATSAGCDVVAAYNSGATADAADAGAFLRLTNQSTDWMREHTADFAFAQAGGDRSLHLFDGPFYYNDTWSSSNPGDIRRWRLAASGTNWTLDAGVNGLVLATGNASYRATLGSAYGTSAHVWVVYGAPDGLHVDRSESGSGWTHDAVASPDTTANGFWWTAISVGADDSQVYLYWERQTFGSGGGRVALSGYHDASGWQTTDETSLFARDPAYDSGQGGADSWTPIQWGSGLGVLCYPYSQWLQTPVSYHVHAMY